jgi:hypothetical protein
MNDELDQEQDDPTNDEQNQVEPEEDTRPWQVVTSKGRVAFEGLEKDARTFLENHYPRVHVEPGSADEPAPDASLKSPNGDVEHFHGPETGYVKQDKEH